MSTHQILRRCVVPVQIAGVWLLLVGAWWLARPNGSLVRGLELAACAGNATIPIGQTPLVAPIRHARVIEGGGEFIYTVALCSKPKAPVTVSLQLDPVAVVQVTVTNPSSYTLHFTPKNYATPQPVSVEALDDDIPESSPQTGVISHTSTSTDSDFTLTAAELPRIELQIFDDETLAHLPLVIFAHTATPTPTPSPTPTPPPASWQQVTATAGHDVDVIVADQGQLIAGDRSAADIQKGIWYITDCAPNAGYGQLVPGLNLRDLSRWGTSWLAATNGQRVYYSSDPRTAWQQTSSSMNPAVFAVAFVTSTLAYAGTDDGVYVSIDQGRQWTKVASSPTLINAFRYEPDTQLLWIATYGGGVWSMSPDQQFVQYVDGLSDSNTDRRVWDILIHNGRMYIATTNGVYVREQSGGGWQRFGVELVGVLVLSLEVAQLNGQERLFAGTVNEGIWHSPLDNGLWQKDSAFPGSTVGDLLYDGAGEFCPPVGGTRYALLAATVDGVYIYR